ncbi:hypothetical protein [Cryobacterium levicorallinum]|uniref:hypothetical protein n=1 Tax=Cryobacterium levicorallinum TaxID=995038 RepID=UPI001F548346|nr:hypothetical protein [Cryobacterium levicorallinum]
MIAAIAFVTLIGLLVLFQLSLAFGAPWGRFAWGGQYPGVLPLGYRIASGVSILIYGFIALLALDRAGVADVFPNAFSQVGIWVVVGYLTLGLVMNAISRSKPERYAMTPVALALAILALRIALSGPAEESFAGMVLDDGDGPVFCTTIMESYPPQCGADSPALTGWDWAAVEHEQSQTIRWGEYRFEGEREGNTISISGSTSPLHRPGAGKEAPHP